MKKREFNKITKELLNKKTGLFSVEKITSLELDMKKELCNYLVKNRHPVILEFIPIYKDYIDWLSAMGYLYYYKNNFFTFLGTSEHSKLFKGNNHAI